MTEQQFTLAAYYAALDRSAFDEALAQVSAAIRFSIVVPTGVIRGEGHDGMRGYFGSRGDVDRRHVLLRSTVEGDMEFVYGAIIEDGMRTTGHFLAAAHVDANRLIDAYQVAFDPEMSLLEASS